MKQITIVIIFILTLGCTSKNSDTMQASSKEGSDCQAGLDYYKANNIKVTEDKDIQGLVFSGSINLSGKGIISGKPALYICDKSGGVTIAGMGDIKIDKNNAEDALKILTPIFMIKASSFYPSEKQKEAFQKIGSKLQSDTEFHTFIEDKYVVRVQTVQADSSGNYFFVIHTGNRKSFAN